MKTVGFWIIGIVCMVAMNAAGADEGETIFKSQGCMLCHKKQSSSKVNPSLIEISMAYQGKEAQLINYLKGESDAIIRPDKASRMRRHIEKTKKLSDADLKSLVDYVLHPK